MTVRSFINFGDAINKAVGINIRFMDASRIEVSYCVLKKEKDVISVTHAAASIASLGHVVEEVKKHVTNGTRIHVNLEGRGVLMRSVAMSENKEDHTQLIKDLFPVVNGDEFFSQVYHGRETNYLCIGKQDLLKLMEPVHTVGSIVSVSLGVFIVGNVLPLMQPGELILPGYKIECREGKIVQVFQQNENTPVRNLQIGDETIPADQLLAYASAFNLFFENPDMDVLYPEPVVRTQAENLFWVSLYKSARVALFIVMAILFINAIAYFWLQGNVHELEAREVYYSKFGSESNQTIRQLTGVADTYAKIGWTSNEIPLFYADQLAGTVADGTRLSILEVGVFDEETFRKDRTYFYRPDLIRVQGMAEDAAVYQYWIRKLEKLSWIKELSGQHYAYDARQRTGNFEFFIHVK